jgi:hypothetical protein
MLNPLMSDDNDVVPESTVAEVAVELSRRHPHREPLQILDEAIAGRSGEELDYEFDTDELRPPHPFAMLLRRAFAPEIDPASLSPQRRWNLIVLPFARRYCTWEPDHTPH